MAYNQECIESGQDDVTGHRYVVKVVAVPHSEVRHVSLYIDYQFTVPTPVTPYRDTHAITEAQPDTEIFHLPDFPNGLSGLQEGIIRMLDRAPIPMAARNHGVRLISEKFLPEYRLNSTAQNVSIGVILQIETRFEGYEVDGSYEVPQLWDEGTDCLYTITVSSAANRSAIGVHEVSLKVEYEFSVTPDCEADGPIAEPNPPGGHWCLEDVPGGLSGLRREIALVLDRAHIPALALEDTIEAIFEKFLTEDRMSLNVRHVVGVHLQTVTRFDFEPDSPGYYNADEEFGRGLEASMDEYYSRETWTPARREAVEALEKVRVRCGDRDTSCVVCLEEYSVGIEVTKMPCSHAFHQDCLARWLESRHFCPLCKFELPYVEEQDSDFLIEEAREEDEYIQL